MRMEGHEEKMIFCKCNREVSGNGNEIYIIDKVLDSYNLTLILEGGLENIFTF